MTFKKKLICELPLKQRETVAKLYVWKTDVSGVVGTYTIHNIHNKYVLAFSLLGNKHCMKNHISKSGNIMESSNRPSKYHLSVNFLAEQGPYFPFPKSSKQEPFSNKKILYFHQLFGSKKTVFPSPKNTKQELFSNQ